MSTAPTSAALALDRGVAERLLRIAREALPHEACAILSGPSGCRATTIHPARNALASPYRYALHPEDLVRIVTGVESSGDELVAIFHSHPSGPAVPSAADIRESRYDVVQLVAGVGRAGTPELRAWRLRAGRAIEVELSG